MDRTTSRALISPIAPESDIFSLRRAPWWNKERGRKLMVAWAGGAFGAGVRGKHRSSNHELKWGDAGWHHGNLKKGLVSGAVYDDRYAHLYEEFPPRQECCFHHAHFSLWGEAGLQEHQLRQWQHNRRIRSGYGCLYQLPVEKHENRFPVDPDRTEQELRSDPQANHQRPPGRDFQ